MVMVESSNVKALDFDTKTNTLLVAFHGGRSYVYFDVNPDDVLEVTFANSVGRKFNELIKGNYECSQVTKS